MKLQGFLTCQLLSTFMAFVAMRPVFAQCPLNPPAFIQSWNRGGCLSNGQLRMPWAVTVDELGDVFVVDTGIGTACGRVIKYSASGDSLNSYADNGLEQNGAAGICSDGQGFLFVCNRDGNNIIKYTSAPSFITSVGVPAPGGNGRYITYDALNDLLLVGCDNGIGVAVDRSLGAILDPAGNQLLFSMPDQVRGVSSRDGIAYFGCRNGLIYRWSVERLPSGRCTATALTPLNPPVPPYSLQVGPTGTLFISDTDGSGNAGTRIYGYYVDSNGAFSQLSCWGGPGTSDGTFTRLTSFIISTTDGTYAVDNAGVGTSRIERFDFSTAAVGDDAPEVAAILTRVIRATPRQLVLSVNLPSSASVALTIVDVAGRKVGSLPEQWLGRGNQVIQWTSQSENGLRSGIYHYVVKSGEFRATGRFVVAK